MIDTGNLKNSKLADTTTLAQSCTEHRGEYRRSYLSKPKWPCNIIEKEGFSNAPIIAVGLLFIVSASCLIYMAFAS